MRFSNRSIYIYLPMFVLFFACGQAYSEVKENRIILAEKFEWITPRQADELLKRIKNAGFNVLVPAVWHGRGTTWPSKLAIREPRWDDYKGFAKDPLKYLVTRAHEEGIEVHAWFTVVLRHGDRIQEYFDEGTPPDAFNIHIPGFRKYIVDLMLEVARNYDVDGINLDYIRSKGICTSPFCAEDYYRKTGRDLLKDVAVHKKNKTAWNSIAKWNNYAITDIVRSFSTQVRKIRSDLIISVDSHPAYDTLIFQGADSIAWANEGLIDLILDMQYHDKVKVDLFEDALKKLDSPDKLTLLVANYESSRLNRRKVWPREAAMVKSLIESARMQARRSNTVALYEYSFLTDEQITALRNGPFKLPAIPTWR